MTQKETDLDLISRQDAIDAMAKWDWQELYLPIHFKQLLEELPSVSTEKPNRCGDAISRQAAIDAVEKTKSAMASDGEIYVAKINAEMNIQQLPSVSTEKTGRWEKLSVCYGCSECSLCTNIHGIRDFKYCPNCGAKMEVGE